MTRCKALFAEAAALPPAERPALLNRACLDDPDLRVEVERLLAAFDGAGDFLESSAVERSVFSRRFDRSGTRIGKYVVREQLGEGGMGVVWKADQTTPVRREVALKLLRPGTESRQVLARFETERRALERMEHPNIARVLDAGSTESGRPYVVMELVRGVAMTTYCDARRLTVADRLALFIPVCRAVQHAHAKGIIHRDLKPSNILVSDDGRLATPKVIDFSIARPVDRSPEEIHFTQNLMLLGTPAYVSPEQAVGSPDVDTRTDVYSLGAVLYQLLCGTTPVDAGSLSTLATDEFLRRLQEDVPLRPSRRLATLGDLPAIADARQTVPAALRRTLAGDLDRIVMKALDKDPARRYETAAALADDLGRFSRHEPVTAARPSAGYHALKFARRHRAGLVGAVLVLLSLLGGAAMSTWLAIRAAGSEARYRREAYISDLNLAEDALRSDDPRRMTDLLERHRPSPGERDQRGFAWHYLYRHCTAPGREIDRFNKPLYFVRLSPDERLLAAAGADGNLRFYDTATWKRTRTIPTGQHEVNGLDFSPDGTQIVSAGDDGTVKIWNVATGSLERSIPVFTAAAFQAVFVRGETGLMLAVCGRDPTIRLFDAGTGEPRGDLVNQDRAIEAIAATDDRRLAAASEDGVPRVWNVATKELLLSWPDRDFDGLTSVAVSPNGRYIAFGTLGRSFVLCDSQSTLPPRAYPINSERPGEGEGAQSLTFGPRGEYLLTADRGGNLRICRFDVDGRPEVDLADGRYPRWAAHSERIYSVAVTADGKQVITAGADGTLWVWRPFDDADAWNISGRGVPYVVDMDVGPDGTVVLAGDESIGLYHIRRGFLKVIGRSDGHRFHAVDMSDDGSLIVGGTQEGRIAVWSHIGDTVSSKWKREVEPGSDVVSLAISPDGRYVAAVLSPRDDRPRELRLFDAASGRALGAVPASSATDIAFRPDAAMIAVDRDNDVLLLEAPSLKIYGTLRGHSQSVEAVVFSPDGETIATGSLDRYVILWDVATKQAKRKILVGGGGIRSLAFSRSGDMILTTGDDLVPRITDLATGRQLMRFPRLAQDHWPMQFLPDDDLVVARHPRQGLYVFDGRPTQDDRAGNMP